MDNLKNSKTIEELIYATEPIAYYFGISPSEFWDLKYSTVNLYIQVNMIKIVDEFKREIELQEAVTNKMLRADGMINKRPKTISLKKMFKDLFKKEPKIKLQSTKEQLENLRSWK